MSIDPIIVALLVICVIAALAYAGKIAAAHSKEREEQRREQAERDEAARLEEERAEQERAAALEELRKAEEERLAEARERKQVADIEIEQNARAFKETHDKLVALVRRKAKDGCDQEFQLRFGVSRPAKAQDPDDDPEVQEFLHEHYAQLRDNALAEMAEYFMQAEFEHRLAAEVAACHSENDEETVSHADEEISCPARDDKEALDSEGLDEEQARDDGADSADEAEPPETVEDENEESPAEPAEPQSEEEPEGPSDQPADDAHRQEVWERVREDFDLDSIRIYMLAAISARFTASNKHIGDLPWPAYTSLSELGYGELSLPPGTPTDIQDAYREFAWKKFHVGKRSEKPTRGEYSWPESHELGDADAGTSVETPVGSLTAQGPDGPLALRMLSRCAWVRQGLVMEDALLEPDGRYLLLVNLEGLRKGDRLRIGFPDTEGFLQEAEDSARTYNAVGQREGVFVGLQVSNPAVASPGEAPCELVERDSQGFVFQMTADARLHDDDTYPQFLQANLVWCQAPTPHPEEIVRHFTA